MRRVQRCRYLLGLGETNNTPNQMSLQEVGAKIFNRWLEVASGSKTKSEAQGFGDAEFISRRIGATM